MRLREFAGDKRSRKITEAAVAAIPYAYYWLVGLFGAAGATSYLQSNPDKVDQLGQALQSQNIPSADKVSQEDLDNLMRVQSPFAMMLKDTWNFITGSDEPTQEEINQRVDDALAAAAQRRAGQQTQQILDKYKGQENLKVDPGLIAAVNKAQTADDEDAEKAKVAAGGAAGAAGIAGAIAGQQGQQSGGQTIGGDDKTVDTAPKTTKPAEPTTDTDPGGTGSSAGDTSSGTGTKPVDGTPQQTGGREGEFGGTTPDKPADQVKPEDPADAKTWDVPAGTSGTDTSGETEVGGKAKDTGTSGEDTADGSGTQADTGSGAIPKPETDVTTGGGAQTGAGTQTGTGTATNTAANTAANTATTTARPGQMPPPIAQPPGAFNYVDGVPDADVVYTGPGRPKKVVRLRTVQ